MDRPWRLITVLLAHSMLSKHVKHCVFQALDGGIGFGRSWLQFIVCVHTSISYDVASFTFRIRPEGCSRFVLPVRSSTDRTAVLPKVVPTSLVDYPSLRTSRSG
jgi:hypothetical protein